MSTTTRKSLGGGGVAGVEEMRKYAPELGARYTVYISTRDLRRRNCAGNQVIVGAIGMSAASMWPYKMLTGLLKY
jgi:hypothetical protein